MTDNYSRMQKSLTFALVNFLEEYRGTFLRRLFGNFLVSGERYVYSCEH
jgi:hypothetical protein